MTIYFFANCELDKERRTFKRGGQAIAIQPLVFDLLQLFAQNANRLLTKDELLDAAWRSSTISESVVARAVMKARKAINPESNSIGLIQTIRRKGYVFSGTVLVENRDNRQGTVALATTPNAFNFAVLPFSLSDRVDGKPWMSVGLAMLLQFLLTEQLGWVCAPFDDVLELNKADKARDKAIERTCRLLGARETIQCTLDQFGNSLMLLVARGTGELPPYEFNLSGGDCVKLTRQLSNHLAGKEWDPSTDATGQSPQLEALCKALHAELQCDPKKAFEYVEHHDQWLSKFAGFQFAKARWYTQMDRTRDARDCFDRSLNLAHTTAAHSTWIAISAERARLEFKSAEMQTATHYCNRAMALAQNSMESKPALVEVLIILSDAQYHQDAIPQSIEHAERAISTAIVVGSLVLQARARLQLASILTRVEHYDRVKGVTDIAVEVARQCEMPTLNMEAARISTLSLDAVRDYVHMCNAAERYVALARESGNEDALHRANVYMLYALVRAQRLLDAEGHPYSSLPVSAVTPLCKPMLLFIQSDLAWMQGDVRMALGRQLQAQRAINRLGLGQDWIRECRAQCAAYFAHMGATKKAEREIAFLKLSGCSSEMLALVEACASVSKGDSNLAIASLRTCWSPTPRLSDDGMNVRFNLAWLLIETPSAQRPGELDSLAASLVDFAPDSVASVVFFAAYMMQRSPSANSTARWENSMARAPFLRRRCPWIASEPYRASLESGPASHRLPLLFTYMC